MSKNLKCYLRCVSSNHSPIFLPNGCPVMLGRMPELKITDKECSRNQLELTANYSKRYVLVKRLGANSSQIDGIEIIRNKSMQLLQNQSLYIVNMKYSHFVTFDGEDSGDTASSTKDQLNPTTTNSNKTVKEIPKTKEKTKMNSNKKLKLLSSSSPTNNGNKIEDEYSFKDSPMQIRKTKLTTKKPGTSTSNLSQNLGVNKVRNLSKTHWSLGLKSATEDPDLIVFKDDRIVIIKDKYPKAKYHWLVLPLKAIFNTSKLNEQHLTLLKHMLEEGKKLALSTDSSASFRYGYHAVASMSQLHMHVISQDFNSTFLKTKKHWNSFTTEYFVDATDIIQEIEEDSKVKDRKSFTKFLNEPLRCHICNILQKNMPALKKHIENCS